MPLIDYKQDSYKDKIYAALREPTKRLKFRCIVPNCGSKFYHVRDKTFHYQNISFARFPANKERRSQWIDLIKKHTGLEISPERARHGNICYNHFHKRYLTYINRLNRAIPTLFPLEIPTSEWKTEDDSIQKVPIATTSLDPLKELCGKEILNDKPANIKFSRNKLEQNISHITKSNNKETSFISHSSNNFLMKNHCIQDQKRISNTKDILKNDYQELIDILEDNKKKNIEASTFLQKIEYHPLKEHDYYRCEDF